jgi:hypothetical protein
MMRYRMIDDLRRFLSVSIASLSVGAGLGVIAALCMTAQLERQYQMAFEEGGAWVGAAVGLFFGWIAYYGIFRQRISLETFCAVVAVTAVSTDVTAYVLHRLTDTGGWLSIFVAVPVFLVASFKLRHAG